MYSPRVTFLLVFTLLSSLVALIVADAQGQTPLAAPKTWRIAIIGAGPSGASTAYYLNQRLGYWGPDVEITVYDAGSEVGGRVQTADVWDNPTIKAELGAPFFNSDDQTFRDVILRYLLPLIKRHQIVPGRGVPWAVWDGEKFVYQQEGQEGGWWDMAKLVWKYGASPIKASKLAEKYMHEFRRMFSYDDVPTYPYPPQPPTNPPDDDDDDDDDHVDLKEAFEEYGKDFFTKRGIESRFLDEIVEPRTRMARAQGLEDMHAFAAMESIRDSGGDGEQVLIENGNWQIFYAMLHSSQAAIELNTRVLNITHRKERAGFWLTTCSTLADDAAINRIASTSYDAVVIATPFSMSNLTLNFPLTRPPANETFLPLHSTFFTSPYPHLSPSAFNLPPDTLLPTNILTTSGPHNTTYPSNSPPSPGFFSARVLRNATRRSADIQITEYVFRIDSPMPLSDALVATLSGIPLHANGTPGVSWLRRHVWENAFVRQEPEGWFTDVEIAPALYYVGGMARLWDGMEASMLMGKEVGRMLGEMLEQGEGYVVGERDSGDV